jgi:hypothetical protein
VETRVGIEVVILKLAKLTVGAVELEGPLFVGQNLWDTPLKKAKLKLLVLIHLRVCLMS